jgi:hypothetical protein
MEIPGFSVLLAFVLASSGLAQTGVVEGTVVDGSGTGLAGVSVYFGIADGKHYETTTDATGSFRIAGMDRGEYGSHFEKDGFVPYYSGSDRDGKPVRAGFGQDITGLRIQLQTFAVVRGKVLDADGDPVGGASVQLGTAVSETADGNGGYVFENVTPGAYYLMASAPGHESKSGKERAQFVPTWFPSAIQPELGEKVTIRGGTDVAYEIKLRTAAVYRVRGKVLDAAGRPAPHVTVAASTEASGAQPRGLTMAVAISSKGAAQPFGPFEPASAGYIVIGLPRPLTGLVHGLTTTNENGAFEFPSVAVGRTHFSVWRNPPFPIEADGAVPFIDAPLNINLSSQGNLHADGQAVVAVDDNIDDLDISLEDTAPSFILSGSAELQDSNANHKDWQGSVLFRAEGSSVTPAATLQADGTFRVSNLTPGKYHILPIPELREDGYLDSVLLGNQDVTGRSVFLGPGSPSIRLIYKANGGGVRGKVENGANATVVLVPQTAFSDVVTDYGRIFYCSASGEFALTNLRPGSYYAWALDISPSKLTDADVLRGLILSSVSVRIEEGATAAQDLKVTHLAQ